MKTRPLNSLSLLVLLSINFSWSLAAGKKDLLGELGVSHEQSTLQYTGSSVAQNVSNMDTDHNGFADVDEVRAYLVLKHGADYQKAILDRWEVSAKSKSCGTASSNASSDAGGLIKELSNN